jgi:hypothetical protein
MDSRSIASGTSVVWDRQPRSFPRMYNALLVGNLRGTPVSISSDNLEPSIMDLREGTGGEFGNIVMANVGTFGVTQSDCGSETRTHVLPPIATAPNYLWFSPNNIINGPGEGFSLAAGCSGLSQSLNVDPPLRIMPSTADVGDKVNPSSPQFLTQSTLFPSAIFSDVDTVPTDGFFTQVPYKGPFGSDNLWIQQWSWLDQPDANGISRLSTEPIPSASTTTTSGMSSADVTILVVGLLMLVLIGAAVAYKVAFRKGVEYITLKEERLTMGGSMPSTDNAVWDEKNISGQVEGEEGAAHGNGTHDTYLEMEPGVEDDGEDM